WRMQRRCCVLVAFCSRTTYCRRLPRVAWNRSITLRPFIRTVPKTATRSSSTARSRSKPLQAAATATPRDALLLSMARKLPTKLPTKRPTKVAPKASVPTAGPFVPASRNLAVLRDVSQTCRGCELWKLGTHTVFGEGTARAKVMFIGEQPGDKEDLSGK